MKLRYWTNNWLYFSGPDERLSVFASKITFDYGIEWVIDVAAAGMKLYKYYEGKRCYLHERRFSEKMVSVQLNLKVNSKPNLVMGSSSEATQLLCTQILVLTSHYQTMRASAGANGMRKFSLAKFLLFGKPDVLLFWTSADQLGIFNPQYLTDFENTAIVVSHDRHFLNKVCNSIWRISILKIKLLHWN